ncbi:Putative FAD/NAD(P)-binding domain superfamily [Septoria linicola]|uniref:FAD/NAD(P)-binding domain superfamily n=1 Tax=Septoria linicola TaxID=215465 RepID=A0A9Q9AQ32_9PEZI|nr:Putative FAD/NAD(P)-binding domain superfamily [Septoria linicola]
MPQQPSITVEQAGPYHVWVRAKDWVPRHHPGRFNIIVNGKTLPAEFGAHGQDWSWEAGGRVELVAGDNSIALREGTPPPNQVNAASRNWRRLINGYPVEPAKKYNFDVVVVGGGVPGVAATLTAARLGLKVALVQNRPVFGGNSSVEVGLRPRGVRGPLIDAIADREPNGDLRAKRLLQNEPNVKVFLEHTTYNAITKGSQIVSTDAHGYRVNEHVRLSASTFIDCSGRAILGLFAGAETLFGQETYDMFGEELAPKQTDGHHHGNTLFFRTRETDSAVSFPDVPWATEVAKGFANLSGQLEKPGVDNGEGPMVGSHDPKLRRRMKAPNTHFWEYGQFLDPYTQGEHIRDHLLQAIYGTFSNVKSMEPEKYANLELDWVAFVAATGEWKRYRGDHILTENDIRSHTPFPDAVVKNGGTFCLHYPHNPEETNAPSSDKLDFRLAYWEWDERDGKDYDIPFRCLYSRNISNLMMAGKHISVSHVAASSTKFMGNGGQHAIATAAAAYLCKKYGGLSPRDVGEKHVVELRDVIAKVVGGEEGRRRRRDSKL